VSTFEQTYLQKLGTNIRKLREKRNLSQFDLASDCNIPKIQIGRIERAEINTTVRTLLKISKALDISIKELFDFEENS